MTLDFFSFDMLTGERLTPLPATSKSWKVAVNSDDSITCTVPADDPGVRKLRVWESTVLARNGLLAVADGVPVAAGPLWKRHLSESEGTMDFTAGGLLSYFKRRVVVPVSARTGSLILQSGPNAGKPDPAFDIVNNGVSDGTLMKRWVQLARAWPGGAIPMSFPQADEAKSGAFSTVKAIDLKVLATLISNLTDNIGGPDFDFRPRFSENGRGIFWEMRYGTNSQPRLGNTDAAAIEWNYGAPGSSAYDLEVDEDASETASQAWASGGAGNDQVLVARAELAKLGLAGFPLLESVNSGNSSVVDQATMQRKADQDANLGQYVASFWSMKVRANAPRAPRLGNDFWKGDTATVGVDRRNPFGMPPGKTVRRIASISGNELNDDYEIAFGEVLV